MRPENGFLCELHILPFQTNSTALEIIQSASKEKRADRSGIQNLTSEKLYGFDVIRWRFQTGKTRLDHYLLIGKKHNYLFISSPYGSHGSMEGILSRTKLR